MYISSSIVNNILYAIWYDMLNIAQQRQQRHDKEGSSGVRMKAAAARQGRQNWRRNNEGSGGATIKRAAAQQ
jgi:hypothetical protein